MRQTKELPEGIKALRRFKVDNGAAVRPHRFELLIDRLNKCASNGRPRLVTCDHCPYMGECIQRFDAICGRVAMSRGPGRNSGRK